MKKLISYFPLLVACVIAAGGHVHRTPEEIEKWNTVPRFCGRFYSKHLKPLGQNSFQASQKSLRKTNIQLYRRQGGILCCNESELVATKTTSWFGGFDFKEQEKGTYWIVVEVQGKKSTLAMNLEPKKGYMTCSDQNFVVNEQGILSYGPTITVD